jgi:hypothetical protein
MAEIRKKKTETGLSFPPSMARSYFGVIVEMSERKLMSPRLRVNPATAYITNCTLAALRTTGSGATPRFVAVAGFNSFNGGRFPKTLEDTVTGTITRLLRVALKDSTGQATASLTEQGYTIHLRLFEDSVTAKEWVETQCLPVEQQTRQIVQKDSKDSLRKAFEAVELALSSLPSGFAARRGALVNLHDHVRAAIARSFESALNERAASLPGDTYEDKKVVARFVNSELREFGLAIRCPKTGLPAFLVAHPGGRPGIGRYHLEVVEFGKPRRTVTSSELPESLKLMPDQMQVRTDEHAPSR